MAHYHELLELRSRSATPSSDVSETFSDTEVVRVYTGHHPVTLSGKKPSVVTGYIIIVAASLFLLIGGWATLFSAFWPHTGYCLLDALAADHHYKYFVVLLVPTTAYFVIANWVGWQYYQNS